MEPLFALSLVLVLSVLARLFASLAGIPVIVPLLVVGVLAGPSVADLINPTELFGDSLSPLVLILVGIILFEGGLGLKREDLSEGVRPAVFRFITFGALITWALATIAVLVLIDVPFPVALLIGAILIVTGPTVVLPLLEFIGPPAKVRNLLRWEGILIDPIGAIIAVVIFGALEAGQSGTAAIELVTVLLTLAVGFVVGLIFARLLMVILGSDRFSGREKVASTLMMVVGSFALADFIFQDAGLLAVIVLGVSLANQTRIRVAYINEFKENLVPILIGILFILLAANVDLDKVFDLGLPGLALVLILVFVVRPLVALTTIGLPFDWRERAFMATMGPRGIIAASTASAFGVVLTQRGVEGADQIVPVTFLVIAGTVVFSAILGPLVAQVLGLKGAGRPALLVVGSPEWALELGRAIREAGADVWVWTEDRDRGGEIGDFGLEVLSGTLDPTSADSDSIVPNLAAVMLVSPDDTLNQLLSVQLVESLEPEQVYRFPLAEGHTEIVQPAGRILLGGQLTAVEAGRRLAAGGRFEVFEPGDEIPEGAVVMASVDRPDTKGRVHIRLLSDADEGLTGPHTNTVALVQGPDIAEQLVG